MSAAPLPIAPGKSHPPGGLAHPWSRFRRALTDFDWSKMDIARGLRNALGVALPLAAGAMAGRMNPALVVATGALNVGFADSTEPYLPRVRRMLGACVLVTLAVFCGSLSGWSMAAGLAGAALWAFGAGLLMSLGAQTGNMGVSCTCVFLIFAAQPLGVGDAALCGALALGGGLFQTGLSALLWPVSPYEPERLALATLYLGLAGLSGRKVQATQGPPGTAGATAAAEALAGRRSDHSAGGERYRALLDQGERIRACMLTLRALRSQVDRMDGPDRRDLAGLMDEYFAAAGRVLEAAGEMLRAGRPWRPAQDGPKPVAEAERILEAFRARAGDAAAPGALTAAPGALTGDIKAQMDALTRQLRVIFDLANNATPPGRLAFDRSEAARSWRFRQQGTLSTLRANFTLKSTAFRHALRLSACVLVADGLGRGLGWYRPYWLPLTVAVVLKPDFSSTFSRGVLRLAGTFVGLGIATGLFHLLPRTLPVEIGLIMAATFILRWSGPAHYGILAMCVSELVVLLVALTGVQPDQVILARARNTAVGGALALLAYWLWPTWERTQVGEIFARMLDAYRKHFELLTRAFSGESPELEAAMDRSRSASRLSRTNLEASVDRLVSEPATPPAERDRWNAMLASSHILAHSLIMLHATLLAAPEGLRPLGENGPFRDFVQAVAVTLERLAAALRGADPGPEGRPDLREAHYRLVHSGEPVAAPHTLIGTETDKMVNSLNTLREQIARGVAGQG